MQLQNSAPSPAQRRLPVEDLVARIYSGDKQAELELRNKIRHILYRYPPADYTVEGHWSDELVEQICNDVWERMLKRGLNRFWFLSGAGERRIKTSLKNFVYNIMIKTASPEQRQFINTVVACFNDDKQFTKKKLSNHSFLMGLSIWEYENRPVCDKNREQLLQLWKENIAWPDMSKANVKRAERSRLFKEMLEAVMEWVMDAHFYNSYRQLINFPRPGAIPKGSDTDEDFVNLDRLLTPAARDRTNIDEFSISALLIAENHAIWKNKITEVFSACDEDQLGFLYYWCLVGMNQTDAARKIGKPPAYATRTKEQLENYFIEFRKSLDPEEITAMSRFLAENLRSMLEGKAK